MPLGVDRSAWRQVGRYLSLGFLLPSCIFVGYLIGVFLDRWFGTHFLYLVFLLFGVAAGLIETIRELNKGGGESDG